MAASHESSAQHHGLAAQLFIAVRPHATKYLLLFEKLDIHERLRHSILVPARLLVDEQRRTAGTQNAGGRTDHLLSNSKSL